MILQEGPTPRWGRRRGNGPTHCQNHLNLNSLTIAPLFRFLKISKRLDFSTVNRQPEATLAKKATIFRRVFCQPMNDFIDFSHCEPYHVSPQRPYSLHIRSVAHALPRSVTKPGNKKWPFPSERPCYGKLSTCRETVARKMPENILNWDDPTNLLTDFRVCCSLVWRFAILDGSIFIILDYRYRPRFIR